MDISALGIHNFWIFVAAGVMLNLTPGQDTMYIVGRSIAEGRKSGIASALGISTGGLIHVTYATLGLSAVLATSVVGFTIVKLLGAFYLIYLGTRLLLERKTIESKFRDKQLSDKGLLTAYRRGILTNVLNPKVALFFLAFLPQFVDPSAKYKSLSFFILGCMFMVTGTLWCLVIAFLSAKASETFNGSSKKIRIIRRVVGSVYIGLGIKLALEH